MPPRKNAAAAPVAALVPKDKEPLDFEDLAGLLKLAEASDAAPAEGEEAPRQTLKGLLGALPDAGAQEALWRRILDTAGEHLRGPPPSASQRAPRGEDEGEGEEVPVDDTPARAVHAVATLLATFAEVLGLCQEMLLSIPDGITQALIARALERVVLGQFEGREDFYGGVLMFLIGTCLTAKTTGTDVSRLYRVRHLFAELDWDHESIESMKMQIMRCVASPNFVRSNHGPELMALFYTVHPGFTAEVHGTVKNQVMYCRPTAVKGYAVALYKAWKVSEAGTRIQLEECIQDWVVLAIRTVRKSADRARQMLEEVHRYHHEDQLSDLLCKLYGPVLWRSLKVANWQVRENAARLLQYIFPLIPSEFGVAEKEQELARQLRILRETLEDPAESVRRVGVSAVCVILKNYWDMMPPSETAELLTSLYTRCARDRRAPMVRAAVCEGFGWILQNALSHPTMAAVLPNLGELLNDRSPLVRAAFVNLLDAVSQCRGVSVSNVVKTDDLFLRLSCEHTEGQAERLQRGLQNSKKPATVATAAGPEAKATPDLVAKRLAKLMAPSLFNTDIVQQVSRCLYFMKSNPLALLAMLTHTQDVIPAADRVKLAAALFRYGLREASGHVSGTAPGPQQRPKMVATMLRIVGVLLEGAASEAPKKRKKGAAPVGHFPKELETFVYEHIKEEDFLHLLKASHEDSGMAARLREDLLFALSSLDPERLPRTAELVQHELTMACRSNDTAYTLVQLSALMRTAVRWNLLGASMEAAWERLQAAAARLGRRQAAPEDVQGALMVAEAAFRDPDVRVTMLKTEAGIVKETIEALTKAFGAALKKGLVELQAPPKSGGAPALLGPGAEAWPRILGFVVRAALHLEHRMAPPTAPSGAAPIRDAEEGEEGTKKKGAGAAQASQSVFAGLAEATLESLAEALTGGSVAEALEALEAMAESMGSLGKGLAKKKAKAGIAAPADLEVVLRAHERLLEALSGASHLAVLRLAPAKGGEGEQEGGAAVAAVEGASRGFASRLKALEASYWRWTALADAVQPEAGPRLPKAWAFSGRIVHQMSNSDIMTPDVIAALKLLLARTNDNLPAQEDLKKVLQQLFARLEYEPQLVDLVASVVGRGEDGAEGSLPDPATYDFDVASLNERVKLVMEELVLTFRNLRNKLRPQVPEPALEAAGPRDLRRVLASPTPQQKMAGGRSSRAPRAEDLEDIDGESVAESEGHRSYSVRSRSPPPRSDSLFETCFQQRGSSVAGSVPGSVTGSVAGSIGGRSQDLD